MTNESILISEVIPATPQRIFTAWMDSAEHSAFTGDEATVVPEVGGEHRAAGGYIQGRTLELNEGTRIVQSWRTTEFPPESPDSRVEITLEPTLGGTLVTLLHTDIPVGQGDRYRQGWNEYYLSRMKAYFSDVDQSSSELGETRAQARGPAAGDAAEMDDDQDSELDLEVEIIEADAVTSVGHRVAGDRTGTARIAPGRANGVSRSARPAARGLKASAKGAAKTPVKSAVKMSAGTAGRGAKTAKKSTSVKKAPRAAARRAVKAPARKPARGGGKSKGKGKAVAARRGAKPGAKAGAKATSGTSKPRTRRSPTRSARTVKGGAGKKTAGTPARKKTGKAKGASPARKRR